MADLQLNCCFYTDEVAVLLRPISTEKKVSEMRKMFALLMRTKISQFRSEEISLRNRVEVKSTFFAFRFRMMQSSQ